MSEADSSVDAGVAGASSSESTADSEALDSGDPGRSVADVVDDLEEKVLAETGDPLGKIADDARGDGIDREGEDAEPPV